MKKSSPAKKNSKKKIPFHQNRWKVAAILVGLVVIFGVTWGIAAHINHNNEIKKEKQQFAQAEQDTNALTSAITAKLGNPLAQESKKNCGYSNQEVGKGFLSCAEGTSLLYPIINEDNAKTLASEASMILEKQATFRDVKSSSYFANTSRSLTMPDHFLDDTYHDKKANLDCKNAYSFFPVANTSITALFAGVDPGNEYLLVEMVCSGYPGQPVYTRSN